MREPRTMCDRFQETAARLPDVVALRTRGDGTRITWRDYAERVRRIAGGLAALGVRRGDGVAILLTNRPEFNLVDTAAIHLGAVPFSIYCTSAPEQVTYLLADAGARVLITEPMLLPLARAGAAGTRAETFVLVEGEAPGAVRLADVEATPATGFDFEATWRAVAPDDLLTLIYTSGTTGPPKGVELSHANMSFELDAFFERRGTHDGARVISYLPHAHIADRMATHYVGMAAGMTVTTCPDPRQLFEHIPEVRPTDFTGVPRVWEKLKSALEARFAGLAPEARAGVERALAASLQKVRLEQRGEPVPDELAAGVARADETIFAPLRKAIGLDQAQAFFVGAAPTPREVLEFFHALGMRIAEVWGMSELSCVATAMPLDKVKIGTVGKALPGVEIAIADDGEVLVRGPIIMRGYRNQPAQTAETVRDGWLATGDIGTLDAEGYLSIVDRKKELIISAAGKNMSPANIEARIKTSSPLIGQACVIGDGRPYLVALLVLDVDGAAVFARARGLDARPESLVEAPEVHAEIARAIAAANERLSRVEQVKRYTLLSGEWPPGGDELTPTMKLKRKPIGAKYAERIEALYSGDA